VHLLAPPSVRSDTPLLSGQFLWLKCRSPFLT
jgi:hypothetical protein